MQDQTPGVGPSGSGADPKVKRLVDGMRNVRSHPINVVDGRTPPMIVEASPEAPAALAGFIAQELERWGFGAIPGPIGRQNWTVVLTPNGRVFNVEVSDAQR